MANSLMNLFNGNSNILLQAFGAMMRGEDPKTFMQNLSNTNPQLRGLNMNDLNGEAQRICQEHGVDAGKLAGEIKQQFMK